MKIELKHLSPYLPYGLKIRKSYNQGVRWNQPKILKYSDLTMRNWQISQPIFRPLSDLTKEIDYGKDFGGKRILINDHTDFSKLICVNKEIENINSLEIKYTAFDLGQINEIFDNLYKLHFDVFGLIDKGLAIDINTMNSNL